MGCWRTRTPADLDQVLAPKVAGAWALQAALDGVELDWVIYCSSAVALVGQTGQAAYAAANAVLDALAHAQQARGQAALSVNWGPLGGAGLAARAAARVQAGWAAAGVRPLPLAAVGPTLAAAWAHALPQLAALAGRLQLDCRRAAYLAISPAGSRSVGAVTLSGAIARRRRV